MKSSPRVQMALVLTVIYLLIIMVQLAPVLGRSVEMVRHCGGDCAECGCSPAQSAARTCCCWQKMAHAGHGNEHEHEGSDNEKGGDTPVWSCGFPCHDDNPSLLWDTDEIALRSAFCGNDTRVIRDDRYWSRADLVLARHDAPPDPPPELSFSRQNAA